jgi:hypothetical protein
MSNEAAFEKLSTILRRAAEVSTLEEARTLIAEAIQPAERLSKAVATAAV